MSETQLVKTQNAIVMPAVDAKGAVEAWKAYQDLKKNIVDPAQDIQVIQGKDFLKKSYWRKLGTFFNLTIEVIEEHHETIGKTIVWHFTVRATADNGRSAIGVGSCDAYEKATLIDGVYKMKGSNGYYPATPNSIHNIRSTAETRATNRAISNLVGGGEVSAEEVDQGQVEHGEVMNAPAPANTSTPAEPAQDEKPNEWQKGKLREIFAAQKTTEEEWLKQHGFKTLDEVPKNEAGDIILAAIGRKEIQA